MVLSKYDQWLSDVKKDKETFEKAIQELKGNGQYEYSATIENLNELQNKLNNALFNYWFSNGENDRYVKHIVNKFLEKHRNLLSFLSSIDSEMRFFILLELKTNETLFANC